jgi:hypothetical protein
VHDSFHIWMAFHRFIVQQNNKNMDTSFESCAVMGCYAARSSYSLPTFRDNLSVPFSRVNNLLFFLCLTLKDGNYFWILEANGKGRLFWNAGKKPPLSLWQPIRQQFLTYSRWKPEIKYTPSALHTAEIEARTFKRKEKWMEKIIQQRV